jgi:hypothetical protein
VPSDRNSGFERTSNCMLGLRVSSCVGFSAHELKGMYMEVMQTRIKLRWRFTICRIRCAVPQGTVLFSTMIVPGFAWIATSLTASSRAVMFEALPAPNPNVLVGVLTARNTMSALEMLLRESDVKIRLGRRLESVTLDSMLPRNSESWSGWTTVRAPSLVTRTILFSPGSCIGR